VEKVANRVITVETVHVPKFYIADYFRYWNELSDEEGVRCFKDWQARRHQLETKPSQPTTGKYNRGSY